MDRLSRKEFYMVASFPIGLLVAINIVLAALP